MSTDFFRQIHSTDSLHTQLRSSTFFNASQPLDTSDESRLSRRSSGSSRDRLSTGDSWRGNRATSRYGSGTATNTALDFIGNTLGNAYNIGNLSGNASFTWRESVSAVDANDYFRFSLSNTGSLNITLDGLSADADIELLDSRGNLIAESANAETVSELIRRSLSAGNYYLRVLSYAGASTNYTLTFRGSGLAADPGNTTTTAHDFGTLSRSFRTWNDAVSSSDINDFYRFDLTESGRFTLSLSGMRADADVQLFNSRGEQIARSINGGSLSESIVSQLTAGTYYVRVYSFAGSNTSYSLRLETAASTTPNPTPVPNPPTPIPTPPNFNSTYGYGLVNAAIAVARAINQGNFADVADLGGINWSNDLVKAPEAWARGYTGQGVTVAVIDDGVDTTHSDLRNNIWVNTREIAGNGRDDDGNGYVDDVNGWNFTTGPRGNNGNVRPESSGSTHGTHVAGTIAAANNGVGVTGVAYNSRIMALKVADTSADDRWVNTGNIARAIRYAVDNGARVINMSLSWSDSIELREALAYAASRNVITISAAGNSSAATPGNPARYATEFGFSVGAVDSQSRIANFSNRAGTSNQMHHVMAPGVSIRSTLPGEQYGNYNGTSMAAPHVAGVVALMLSANPNLTHAQVRQILTGTATRLA
jgi:hypothetical protein